MVPVSATGARLPLTTRTPSTVTVSPSRCERAGLEGQLGVVGDVEEVRRREVRREVGVVDVDARRLCDAADALLVEGRLELAERALERRNAHVDDGEADGRVGRVGHPAPRHGRRLDGDAHRSVLLSLLEKYLSLQVTEERGAGIPG